VIVKELNPTLHQSFVGQSQKNSLRTTPARDMALVTAGIQAVRCELIGKGTWHQRYLFMQGPPELAVVFDLCLLKLRERAICAHVHTINDDISIPPPDGVSDTAACDLVRGPIRKM